MLEMGDINISSRVNYAIRINENKSINTDYGSAYVCFREDETGLGIEESYAVFEALEDHVEKAAASESPNFDIFFLGAYSEVSAVARKLAIAYHTITKELGNTEPDRLVAHVSCVSHEFPDRQLVSFSLYNRDLKNRCGVYRVTLILDNTDIANSLEELNNLLGEELRKMPHGGYYGCVDVTFSEI